MDHRQPFTGHARRRTTSRSVKLADGLAQVLITVGGIGAIGSLLGMCVFLAWVVWPLLLPAKVQETQRTTVAWAPAPPGRVATDEYRLLGSAWEPDGRLRVFRLDTGATVAEHSLGGPARLTAWSTITPGAADVALGYEDGTFRLGQIRFVAESLTPERVAHLSATIRDSPQGQIVAWEGGLIERVGAQQYRWHRLAAELGEPLASGSASAIRLIDYAPAAGGSICATLTADGALRLHRIRKRATLLASAAAGPLESIRVPSASAAGGAPAFLVLSGQSLCLAADDGTLARYDISDARRPRLAETLQLVDDPAARLTALVPLIGRGTLVTGDSRGRLRGWFLVKPEGLDTIDHATLVAAHELPSRASAVTALAASARSRIICVGYDDGHAAVVQVTTAARLVELPATDGHPVTAINLSPKEDGCLASTPQGMALATVDLRYPEATLSSLFRPVWYQDYSAPAYVWQSSGGSDANEPKLSIVPLIFGTLKATLYSLLFGVPLALLGAIYSSEFLSREAKSRIKPTIELMASLPSVVLGYLAAFVLAPLAARWLPAVLSSFLTLPLTLLLGAYLWQLLPSRLGMRVARWRFLWILAALPLGIAAAAVVGSAVEERLFSGNLRQWLGGAGGSPLGGWFLLLLPAIAIFTGLLVAREVTPQLRRLSADWSRARCAFLDLAKFTAGVTFALGAALALAALLTALGLDPRGWFFGSYVQRNALIVGFAMGFAIIPIIYTLADDALSTVPEHLRSASLGAGATPWQTTMRIVIPTAMSGLFSAVMIGLGRAVGETMIVLMAAGNTPVMEWNIFNGFRTLSANLAVELPEADQGSTHFRILFLTALVLFAMTFVINTLADAVRQRFRRRAYQL